MYDLKIFSSKSFDVPIIGIGNLSTGGTGKTPMSEYIIQILLENGHRPAMLSRGYGRNTKGYVEAALKMNSEVVGDEPNQVKNKFPAVCVAVCEDRVTGVEKIMKDHPDVDVIVLDDCFQHRKIKPGFNILLTEYNLPYYKNYLLPSGTLREPVSSRKRADVIILTKCPENISQKTKKIQTELLKVSKKQKAFFTNINYALPRKLNTGIDHSKPVSFDNIWTNKIIMFTGIANNKPIEVFLEGTGARYKMMKFPDHYKYSVSDIENIIQKWKNTSQDEKLLLTTEKDWRRIQGLPQEKAFEGIPLYYLPISVQWKDREKVEFDEMLLNYVQSNRKGL